MIKLVKIGDVIHNYTEDPKSISFIMIDTDNKDEKVANLSTYVLSNNKFVDKYPIMKSKGIVRIEKSYTENLEIDTKIMHEGPKIKEVIDFIVVTETNIYVIDDISYYRDIKLKKLGL